ncbi:MAG: alpha/beta hydrolase [Gammaproteobacteria bacterium]|nr:alpha/beta hydrolase [Gammaproteobacteria bacterium]
MIKKIGLVLLTMLVLAMAITWLSYLNFRSEQLAALESDSQIANTSAGPIEYRFVGDSGPILLFLHGTPGGYDQLDGMEGFRVLVPSRPGYLRTPIWVGRSPREQAQAFAALLDTLNITSVVVMGGSGGGPSAIAFAARYPDRTLALIAMEAVSQSTQEEDEASEMPAFMRSDFSMWVILSIMENFMGADAIVKMLVPDEANQELILSDADKTATVGSLLWSTWPISQREVGQLNDFAQFERLDLASDEITVPTLIIHGSNDINVPFSQSETLADQIPGSILHVVEGGDHMMPFSHEEEVAMAIEQFLTRNNIR